MNLRLTVLIVFSFFVHGTAVGQDCPINTPEFPILTDDDWDPYSWSSNLYLPDQVGGAQTLNEITFRVDNVDWGSCTYTDQKIFIRHTSEVDFSGNTSHPGYTDFVEVFDGDYNFGGNGTYTYSFHTPFVYNGSDVLEILFENRSGDYCNEEPWFDRIDGRTDGVMPGKLGWGWNWTSAQGHSGTAREFTLALSLSGCGSYTLPVELLYLKPSCSNDVITLDWATASETNNSHFTFYGSHDGRNFDKLLRIEGRGNTMMTEKYQAVVENTEGYQYVKMVQEDFDGTRHEYSPKTIKCESKQELDILRTFPNPSNQGHFSLELSAFDHTDAQVQLATVDGRTVHGQVYQVNKGLNLLEIQPRTSLKPGLYILTVTYNNKVMDQEKIVVNR